MQEMLIQAVGSWLGPLVQLTVLVGAGAAAYKFRVFNVLWHKYRSEVWCGSIPPQKRLLQWLCNPMDSCWSAYAPVHPELDLPPD